MNDRLSEIGYEESVP